MGLKAFKPGCMRRVRQQKTILGVKLERNMGSPKKETLYDFRAPALGTFWVVTVSMEMSTGAPICCWRAALLEAEAVFPRVWVCVAPL